MKSVLVLCLVYITLLLGCAVSCKKTTHIAPPTLAPERLYSHSITYLDDEEEGRGMCTATAIGPHALLTALHCDPLGKRLKVRIDLATHDYHVIAGYTDDRDHLIIMLDGPAFTNIAPFRFRPAVMGEHVYTYAYGGWNYPSHRYDGYVIPEINGGDTSDVDLAAGITNYSFAPIPGDSGAAVYGNDGYIVGLITYARNLNKKKSEYGTGFELNFDPAIYDVISK